jgi:hypothetical protein
LPEGALKANTLLSKKRADMLCASFLWLDFSYKDESIKFIGVRQANFRICVYERAYARSYTQIRKFACNFVLFSVK